MDACHSSGGKHSVTVTVNSSFSSWAPGCELTSVCKILMAQVPYLELAPGK